MLGTLSRRLLSAAFALTLVTSQFTFAGVGSADPVQKMEMYLEVSNDHPSPGDEITVDVMARNMQEIAPDGIEWINTNVDYDNQVFESTPYGMDLGGWFMYDDASSGGTGYSAGDYFTTDEITAPNYVPDDTDINQLSLNMSASSSVPNVDQKLMSFKLKVTDNPPQDIHSALSFGTFSLKPVNADTFDDEYATLTPADMVIGDPDTADVKAALETVEIGYAQGDDKDSVTQDLTLSSIGDYGTTVSWSSDTPTVVKSDGTVIPPAYPQGDAAVTLTATVKKGSSSDTVNFPVKVLALPETDAEAVSYAYDHLDIGYAAGDSAQSVTQKLTLSSDQIHGANIAWESSDTAVIANDGTVTRPASTEASDAHVVLTANISKVAASTQKTFNVTVIRQPSTPKTVQSIDASYADKTVEVGQGFVQELIRTYTDGTTDKVSPGDVTWSSSDITVATITNGVNGGSVDPIGVGTTTIKGTYQGIDYPMTLSVVPAVPQATTNDLLTFTSQPYIYTSIDPTNKEIKMVLPYGFDSASEPTIPVTFTHNGDHVLYNGQPLQSGDSINTSNLDGMTLEVVSEAGGHNVYTIDVHEVVGYQLSKTTDSVHVGDTFALPMATYLVDDGTTVGEPVNVPSWNVDLSLVHSSGSNMVADHAGTAVFTTHTNLPTATFTVTIAEAVQAPIYKELRVSRSEGDLLVGHSIQANARAVQISDDAEVNVNNTAAWISSNPTVATVDDGLVTGVSAGDTVVTATYAGFHIDVPFHVVAPSTSKGILSFEFDGVSAAIDQNAKTITVVMPYGYNKTMVPVTFTHNGASVMFMGNIPISGLAQDNCTLNASLLNGATFTVTAQDGTTAVYTLNYSVSQTSIALSRLSASPTSLTLEAAAQVTVPTITAIYSDNTQSNVTSDVAWSTATSGVVSVTNGQVYGENAGTTTLTATFGSQHIDIPVTVTAPVVLTALSVTPNSASVKAGYTQQLVVTASYSDGHTETVTSLAAYTSSNIHVAAVSASGLITAVHSGSAEITVTYGQFQQAVTIQVPSHNSKSSNKGSSTASTPTAATTTEQTQSEPASTSTPTSTSAPSQPESTPAKTSDIFKSTVVKDTDVAQEIKKKVEDAIEASHSNGSEPLPQDIHGHWAEASLDKLTKIGVFTGYEDGSLKPDGKITRAEFSVLISRAFGLTVNTSVTTTMNDVQNHWAKDAISTLAFLGILNGYDDDTFKPNKEISREEMVTIITRILNLQNNSGQTSSKEFTDESEISSYAQDAVTEATDLGIISGLDGNRFEPQESTTRAEVAEILIKTLSLNPDVKTLLDSLN